MSHVAAVLLDVGRPILLRRGEDLGQGELEDVREMGIVAPGDREVPGGTEPPGDTDRDDPQCLRELTTL